MKIYKQNEHSLLIRVFGIKDILYLTTTILIYFDLNSPDDPLKEQDLWQTIPDRLDSGAVLDQGMPKPVGEVLVTGSCFAPKDEKINASRVSLRVGDLHKSLYVFGNRYWTNVDRPMGNVTEPELFSEMALSYENAFGGKDFNRNPSGKGIHPVQMPTGEIRIPLPNIENPDHMIANREDRPGPAGFGPLDMIWPQRMSKTGTYDDKWQKERWPYFPDDMNYEFFNTAPEDQFIPGFFKGGEEVLLENMHPDLPSIRSHLPRLRPRCFVTKYKDLKPAREKEEIFQEVKTHLDTVHFFPEILRGVAMYRGTTEILDDEYADVIRIFIATEKQDQEPESAEYYLEAQKKAADRSVPIDTSPFEQMQPQIAAAMKKIKKIPKEIERVKLQALGKSPKMPPPSPREMAAHSKTIIDQNLAVLDKLEAQARGMQAQHGHLAPIDLNRFTALRAKLKDTGQRIDKAVAKLDEAQKKGQAVEKNVSAQLKQNVKPEQLAQAGIDPDNLLKPKPINPWHDRGFPFVVQCRKNLEQDTETLAGLQSLGLERQTIKRAWLGLNREEVTEEPALWGLEETEAPVQLPAGLVIPRFDDAILKRILIRKVDYSQPGQDLLATGSKEAPLFIEAEDGAPVVRVQSELEALFLAQEIGDACSVISLEGPDEKPEDQAAQALETSLAFLVLVPEETLFSEKEWAPWAKAFPDARKLHLPAGKTVFEARKKGVDLRHWILDALPAEFAEGHSLDLPGLAPGQPPGKDFLAGLSLAFPDVKGLINQALEEVTAAFQPKKDAMLAKQNTLIEQAKQSLIKAGQDPEALLPATAKQPRKPFDQLGREIAGKIDQRRGQLRSMGRLTPEVEEKMKAQAAKAVSFGHGSEQQFQAGLAKIETGKKKLADAKVQIKAGAPPAEAGPYFKKAGLDPERMKNRTREEVIELHGRGESLAGAILSQVDLSGLDLRGIDLRQAQCLKTNFSGSNLEGANLGRVMASEADFSKAVLKKASLEMGLFPKASFQETDLREADLKQTILKEADMTKADFSGARINMAIMQKAVLNQARFNQTRAELTVFSGAEASGADFSSSNLFKCLFKGTRLDQADFSGAVLNSTMLQGAGGQGVRFRGANLDKTRMADNTSLPGADFTGASMRQACFRDSDLSGSAFKGGLLEKTMIENCNLSGADFERVSALESRFSKSNLEGARMKAANLAMGSLRKARLVNTDLRGANLFSVDCFKAEFGRTRLELANLKRTLIYKHTEVLE